MSSALESDWDAVADAGSKLEEQLRSINPFLDSLDVPEGEVAITQESDEEKRNEAEELRNLMRKQADLITSLQDAIKNNKLTANKAADGLTDVERLMVESGRIIEMLGKDLEEARAEIESLKAMQSQAPENEEQAVEAEVAESADDSDEADSAGDSNDPFVNILENRIKALEKKNKESEETIEQLQKENQKLVNKLDAAKAHAGGSKELDALSQQLDLKDKELADLQSEFEKLESEYMNLFENASGQ